MRLKALACAVICSAFALGAANSGGEKKADGGKPFAVGREDGDPVPLPAVLKRKPMAAKAGDDELRKLMIARYNIALLEAEKRFGVSARFANFEPGAADQTVKRLFEAELALADDAEARVTACANYLDLAKFLDEGVAEVIKAGARVKHAADYETCHFLRADAEVRLLTAKRQAGVK